MSNRTNPLAGLSLVYQDETKTIRVCPNNWMLLRQRPDSATTCWMLDADMAVPPELAGIAAALLQEYEFRYGKPCDIMESLSAAIEFGDAMAAAWPQPTDGAGEGEGVV